MKEISKKIHYCWFGKSPKPEIVERCIHSWKRNLPDYEIIEWNEDNFPISNFEFAQNAYELKKWAFVSDYCRLWVLYNYGGIYLDTDMEVLKNLDPFLKNKSFGGFESDSQVNMAIWGCQPKDSFIGSLLDVYNSLNFKDYIDDLVEIAIPRIITNEIKNFDFSISNQIIKLENDLVIYPRQYFYPKEHSWEPVKITKNTYCIHHYEGSWKSPYKQFRTNVKSFLVKVIGYENATKITNLIKRNKEL